MKLQKSNFDSINILDIANNIKFNHLNLMRAERKVARSKYGINLAL